MNAEQRVAASRAEQPDDLTANEGGYDGISLRAAPMKRNITSNQPGIRGMSDNTGSVLLSATTLAALRRSRRGTD